MNTPETDGLPLDEGAKQRINSIAINTDDEFYPVAIVHCDDKDDKAAALERFHISILRTLPLTRKQLLANIESMRAQGCKPGENRIMRYLESRVSAFRDDTETLRNLEARLVENN
jgi:hypothetical protein